MLQMAEAKEYFERIVKEYRVKPTSFMYSNLIKGYAKKSDLKRCLSLYSDVSVPFSYLIACVSFVTLS